MKIYPLEDKNGCKIGFEIESSYISLRKIVEILSTVDKVSKIQTRRLFERSNGKHIEFEFEGEWFVVMEPFGDNSRYWIGPKDKPKISINLSDIENAFEEYSPSIILEIIGDLVSFKINKILKRIGK